ARPPRAAAPRRMRLLCRAACAGSGVGACLPRRASGQPATRSPASSGRTRTPRSSWKRARPTESTPNTWRTRAAGLPATSALGSSRRAPTVTTPPSKAQGPARRARTRRPQRGCAPASSWTRWITSSSRRTGRLSR
ncbi:unnamed protein product, partial [Prorocentrum cordatum]